MNKTIKKDPQFELFKKFNLLLLKNATPSKEEELQRWTNFRNELTRQALYTGGIIRTIIIQQVEMVNDLIKKIREPEGEDAIKLDEKKLFNQYDKIRKHKLVQKLSVNDLSTLLYITTWQIEFDGKQIGEYLITVNNTKSGYVPKIRNLTYRVDGRYDHPHIKDENCCLGEYNDILKKYFDSKNLYLFIGAIIHYLQGIGDKSPYIRFDRWWRAFEKKEPLPPGEGQLTAGAIRINEDWTTGPGITTTGGALNGTYIGLDYYAQEYFVDPQRRDIGPMVSPPYSQEQEAQIRGLQVDRMVVDEAHFPPQELIRIQQEQTERGRAQRQEIATEMGRRLGLSREGREMPDS